MVDRLAVVGGDVAEVAAQVRSMVPAPASVHEVVAGIIASVEEGGDDALLMHERRFGGGDGPLRVPEEELAAALEALDPAVRAGLELALANVRAVAEEGLGAGPRRRARRRGRSCACARSPSPAPPSTRRAAASRTRAPS